ncbi:MAG: glycosyltransferase [Candidatus Aenigmarchaeota archaeon]|nr:glycosyltransferase [Candidatus Aenigmarchaeota archaeon]
MTKRGYVVITAARDEEKYIEKTIRCVISQTILPIEWVIVNDGSHDNTGNIIDTYASRYAWIRAVHRDNRGYRKAGGGVIEAFYDGYQSLGCNDWEFIAKLDGDLSFDAHYFRSCFLEFDRNPNLGIGGGVVGHIINGKLEIEKHPLFHVRGATKIYKRDCWDAIGGLVKEPGWDTLDEVKANMLGWTTKSFPHIKIVHHKFTRSADSTWSTWVKNGRANYISGYHPLFMVFKCIKRILQKPYLIATLGLSWGFVSGYLKKIPQVNDSQLRDYLRNQQIRRLFRRNTIWK